MSLHFAPKEKVYFVLNSNGVVLTWSALKQQCIQYIESRGGIYNES